MSTRIGAAGLAVALGLGLGLGLEAGLSGAASAQVQVALPLDRIAPEALAMAREAAPDADFREADMELDENGHHSVEIAGVGADGRHVEVDLYQEGEVWVLDEIERHINWDETPMAVRGMLGVLFLDSWRPSLVERSQRPGGVVVYEIEGVDALGEAIEVEISDTGRLLGIYKYNAS